MLVGTYFFTLIKCLKGHKFLGSLCSVVKTPNVRGNGEPDQARDKMESRKLKMKRKHNCCTRNKFKRHQKTTFQEFGLRRYHFMDFPSDEDFDETEWNVLTANPIQSSNSFQRLCQYLKWDFGI